MASVQSKFMGPRGLLPTVVSNQRVQTQAQYPGHSRPIARHALVALKPGHFSGHLLGTRSVAPLHFSASLREASVPVVDISAIVSGTATPAEKLAFATALGEGLKQNGFVAVVGHGVKPALMKQYYQELQTVFALSKEVKDSYARPNIGYQRGYLPPVEKKGLKEGDQKSITDKKECWQAGAGLNVYPSEVPSFGPTNQKVFQEMERVGIELVKGLDDYLGANGKLLGLVQDNTGKAIGTHMMRTIHYPPVTDDQLEHIKLESAAGEPAQYSRAGVHADMNLITLLPEATMSGLELKRKNNQGWLPVFAQEGAIIVNAADMLQAITKGTDKEIPSTPHRVVGSADQVKQTRFSVPFFMLPNHLKPLVNLQTGQPIEAYGRTINESGMFVYERLKGHGAVKDVSYDEWKAGNMPLINR